MPELTEVDLQSLSRGELIALVKRGIVRVMAAPNALQSLAMSKESLPEYKRFSHLVGNGISISEASRKYNTPQPTISRWVHRGFIRRIGKDKNRVLIDEADIAYCAHVAASRPGQGKWLFNPDGTPYIPD